MSNKYLEKIAKFPTGVFNGRKERDLLDALTLGMSSTGLAISTNNYLNNNRTRKEAEKKTKLEAKSLEVLHDIHKAIERRN